MFGPARPGQTRPAQMQFFLLYLRFSFGASKSPATEMSSLEPLEKGGVEISFHVPNELPRPRRPGQAIRLLSSLSPRCSQTDKALECQGSDSAVPAPGDRRHGKVHPGAHRCKGLPIYLPLPLPLPLSLPLKPDVWPWALCSVPLLPFSSLQAWSSCDSAVKQRQHPAPPLILSNSDTVAGRKGCVISDVPLAWVLFGIKMLLLPLRKI